MSNDSIEIFDASEAETDGDWLAIMDEIGEEAGYLESLDVSICIVPGARFPKGCVLPPDFPYEWIGHEGTSWDTVGLMVHTSVACSVLILEEFLDKSTRMLWFALGDMLPC